MSPLIELWTRLRAALDALGGLIGRLADNNRTELLVAGLVFIVESSVTRPMPKPSGGGAETWLNLTNQMFYGQQDFLFSYGPLFWLVGGAAQPFDARTYWLSVIVLSALSAGFWSPLITLCHRHRALPLFGVAFFLFFGDLTFPPMRFLWPFAIVAHLEYRHDRPVVLHPAAIWVLGVLVGTAFYIRYLYGLVGLIIFAAYFLSRITVTRRPWELLANLGGVFVGYVLAGLAIFRSSASLFEYIAINTEISFGNSVDLTLGTVTRATLVAIAAVALPIAGAVLLSRRTLFLSVALLLALLIKLGFSRGDHQFAYFVTPVAALSLLLLFCGVRFARIAFVVVTGLLFQMSAMPFYPGAPTRRSLLPSIDLTADYDTRMQAMYAAFRLPDDVRRTIGQATIDVYPFQNEIVFANRLNYRHRPLFQNFMTLTPALDRRNQAFFEGAERPQFVLWAGRNACAADCIQFVDVDDKLALNEDPLTSTAILTNYHVVARSQTASGLPLMLLEQNPAPAPHTQTLLGETEMTLGRWYPVPRVADGVVKLLPDFAFTTTGLLQNLLFRGDVMTVSYRLATGVTRSFRLNILNARSGIWISPLPSGFDLAGIRVEAIRIDSARSGYVVPDFHARWVDMPIAAVHTVPPSGSPAGSVAHDPAPTPSLAR